MRWSERGVQRLAVASYGRRREPLVLGDVDAVLAIGDTIQADARSADELLAISERLPVFVGWSTAVMEKGPAVASLHRQATQALGLGRPQVGEAVHELSFGQWTLRCESVPVAHMLGAPWQPAVHAGCLTLGGDWRWRLPDGTNPLGERIRTDPSLRHGWNHIVLEPDTVPRIAFIAARGAR